MSILDTLKEEREKLDRAISALEGDSIVKQKYTKRNGKRKWSTAAKKRLSVILKKRWAQRKKANKK